MRHGTKNHIFHLFGARKYVLFVSFQHIRKYDFLSQKNKEKTVLSYVFNAVGKAIFSALEN